MQTQELINLNNTSRKTKLYLKMNTIESLQKNFTFLRLCEHIGEAHLFEWICIKAMKNENFFYYHDTNNVNQFEKEFNIKPSTQHKYLKLLVQKSLIFKKKNGVYQPNEKYIEFNIK